MSDFLIVLSCFLETGSPFVAQASLELRSSHPRIIHVYHKAHQSDLIVCVTFTPKADVPPKSSTTLGLLYSQRHLQERAAQSM